MNEKPFKEMPEGDEDSNPQGQGVQVEYLGAGWRQEEAAYSRSMNGGPRDRRDDTTVSDSRARAEDFWADLAV